MLNKVFGIVFVALGILLAIGVGADFSDYKAQRSVHIAIVADDQEFIDLYPIQPYAYISEAGMLVVDFSPNNPNYPDGGGLGISPDAEYNFDSVFGVSNHIWANDSESETPIVVTINSSSQDVELYCKDDPSNPAGNLCYRNEGNTPPAYNSDTAGQEIIFCLDNGQVKEIGMDLNGPTSVSTQWLNGTLSIHAEPDTDGFCGGS